MEIDDEFMHEADMFIRDDVDRHREASHVEVRDSTQDDSVMKKFRDNMAEKMWVDYNDYLRKHGRM